MDWTNAFAPRRPLGKTGFVATQLGVGDLADRNVSLDECVATARRAIDAGLNVIDTAPSYENGYSEQIVGQAVRGWRDKLFLIDKIDHPDEPVAVQVDASLSRLNLDHTDLFVFHGVSQMDVWQRLAEPGGGFDQLEVCRCAGKTRFRGVSSHHPDVLRAAIESGLCDVVMYAVGPFADARFIDEILPLAKTRGVGTVCFKTFGAGKLVADTAGYGRALPVQPRPRGKFSSGPDGGEGESSLPKMSPADCLHYTLTCDPDVALLGLSFPNEQDVAFEAAVNFKPLPAERMAAIRARAAEVIQHKGDVWWNPKA